METIIRYCDRCGLRIQDRDLASGVARALEDHRAICAQCAPSVPDPTNASSARRGSQARIPAPGASGRSSAALHRQREVYRTRSNQLLIYTGAGVLVILVPILLLMVSGGGSHKETRKTANRSPEPARPAPTPARPAPTPEAPRRTATSALPSTPAAATSTPASGSAEKKAGFSMSSFRDELADGEWKRLKTQTFADEISRYRALSAFIKSYAGTPSAREAETARAAIKVPADQVELSEWSKHWSYGPATTGLYVWHEEYNGHPYICETHPYTPALPMWIKRRMKVPEDRPYFETEVFGNGNGDREVWLEADGEAMPHVKSERDQTYILTLDLSERKGREVEFALVHASCGEWNSEHAFWSFPNFVKEPRAGAQIYKVTGAAPPPPPPVLVLPDEAAWTKGVNLLATAKPEQDTVRGTWRLEDGKLLCVEHSQDAMLALPYEPPREYDYRIRFTPLGGNHEVDVALRVNGHSTLWIMAGFGNTCAGFDRFEGRGANDNASTVRKTDFIVIGKEYTCVLRVRREGIYAFLDGQLVSTLTTDGRNLDISSTWALTGKEACLGVGAQDTVVSFSAIDVLEVDGSGRMTR